MILSYFVGQTRPAAALVIASRRGFLSHPYLYHSRFVECQARIQIQAIWMINPVKEISNEERAHNSPAVQTLNLNPNLYLPHSLNFPTINFPSLETVRFLQNQLLKSLQTLTTHVSSIHLVLELQLPPKVQRGNLSWPLSNRSNTRRSN